MEIILETKSLYLRRFVPEDLDELVALHGDERVMRYIGKGHTRTREETEAFLNQRIGYYHHYPGLGLWAVTAKTSSGRPGRFIGWAGLIHLDHTEEIEVGYRLHWKERGRGYATELAIALVDYGQRELGLERVVAVADPGNDASRRVLEKAGLIHTGQGRYYGRDCVYYERDLRPVLDKRSYIPN